MSAPQNVGALKCQLLKMSALKKCQLLKMSALKKYSKFKSKCAYINHSKSNNTSAYINVSAYKSACAYNLRSASKLLLFGLGGSPLCSPSQPGWSSRSYSRSLLLKVLLLHLLVLKWDLFTNPLSLYGRRVRRTGTAGGTGTPWRKHAKMSAP